MEKRSEFRKLVLYLFDDYPHSSIKESELKEVFKNEGEIKSLLEHGFLVEGFKDRNKEKNFRLGPHTIELVSVWKAEEIATKVQRLTILVLVFGAGILMVSGLLLVMQLVQFFLK